MEVKVTISSSLISKLDALKQASQGDGIMREVATTMLAQVHDRIHEQGLNAQGGQIGIYSPGYMKVRTGDYGNSSRYSRGKHKGDAKDAGNFTKGKNKGAARPRYNRSADPRVVLSLTRQMENDFKVVATDRGYGLGYSNEQNFQKAQWAEEKYGKQIFSLTDGERELAVNIAKQEILKIFNQ